MQVSRLTLSVGPFSGPNSSVSEEQQQRHCSEQILTPRSTAARTPYVVEDVRAGFQHWLDKGTRLTAYPTGNGRLWDCDNHRELIDFATCSYLGLENEEFLKKAGAEGMQKYGIAPVASAVFIRSPLVVEVETLVGQKLGGYFMLTSKTHIGTTAFITTRNPQDEVMLVDSSAHASIHSAADMAARRGVRVHIIKQYDLHAIRTMVEEENSTTKRFWYCCDGVHSMNGKVLDPEFARSVLKVSPKMHLYIDDAHGFGWTGKSGRGAFLESFLPYGEHEPRLVLAISLCKAVSSLGGGLLFYDRECMLSVANGSIVNFVTGPLHNSALAMTLAFFHWIDTADGVARQKKLANNISHFNNRMQQYNSSIPESMRVPICNYEPLPLKFIHTGTVDVAIDIIIKMRNEGICMCQESFPFAQKGHAGIRMTITAGVSTEDVDKAANLIIKYCRGLPPLQQHCFDPVYSNKFPACF